MKVFDQNSVANIADITFPVTQPPGSLATDILSICSLQVAFDSCLETAEQISNSQWDRSERPRGSSGGYIDRFEQTHTKLSLETIVEVLMGAAKVSLILSAGPRLKILKLSMHTWLWCCNNTWFKISEHSFPTQQSPMSA